MPFSIVAAPIYIPTSNAQALPFLCVITDRLLVGCSLSVIMGICS